MGEYFLQRNESFLSMVLRMLAAKESKFLAASVSKIELHDDGEDKRNPTPKDIVMFVVLKTKQSDSIISTSTSM